MVNLLHLLLNQVPYPSSLARLGRAIPEQAALPVELYLPQQFMAPGACCDTVTSRVGIC